MVQILVVGSAVTDMVFEVERFPDAPEKYAAHSAHIVGGGCAANAAVAIARLGGTPILSARMGRDLIGDLTLQDLEAEGVNCANVLRTEDGQSAFSSVYVTPDGERQIMAFRGQKLPQAAEYKSLFPQAILADTRWPEAADAALDHARSLGIPGILDGEAPVPAALAAKASHVAFSAQGLREFTGEADLAAALSKAKDAIPGWLCVTDGANGTLTQTGHHPAFPITPTDTLGAGDVWHGAFALRLAEGASEAEAIRFAAATAALKCTRRGGRRGTPSRQETEEFLARTST